MGNDMAHALADAMAQAIRAARRPRGGATSDGSDEDDGTTPAKVFTDARAKRVALHPEPLEFFLLPPCARTSFPAPFRMETIRFREDFPEDVASAEGDEARHLTILGAWLTRVHNELLEFTDGPDADNPDKTRGALFRARVYAHQLAELCAARYDVVKKPDGAVAAQLQLRLLSPPDTHASKARRGIDAETIVIQDRMLNKGIAENAVKEVQAGGRRRGRRGQRGKRGDPPAAPAA